MVGSGVNIPEPLRVFIGYDTREREAFGVCESSLRRHATIPLLIERLDVRRLAHAGLYCRAWRVENGQFLDVNDGAPFSTEFSYSRFLVPALCQWQGWAIFCDCDFLWRDDVREVLRKVRPCHAVSVVKHDHEPVESVKMDGRIQSRYYRKNWSSLIVFNNGHAANLLLTPEKVNAARGQWLHAFGWLEDDEIGALAPEWNWLEGSSDPLIEPRAVHFTRGGPWHPNWQRVAYGDEWRAEAARIADRVEVGW
jgi:hypothetical protein